MREVIVNYISKWHLGNYMEMGISNGYENPYKHGIWVFFAYENAYRKLAF